MKFKIAQRIFLQVGQGSEIERLTEHRNAFGFLRLLFASLVIVSHTPEMVDGNRNREILTRIFGTLSFGELAVDGFFVISGYLIVGSFLKDPRFWPYLAKRLARIYPGFIAASVVALILVAPLAGADVYQHLSSPAQILHAAGNTLFLQGPKLTGTFPGNHLLSLNGAMWTIAYEFRCYLLVLVLGFTGALRRPWLVAALAIALLCAATTFPPGLWNRGDARIPHLYRLLGNLKYDARLIGIFLVGSVFYLKREVIHFSVARCIVALAGMIGLLFMPHLAEIGVATFGAYLVFGIAKFGKSWPISKVNNRDDISYGVYLYAWPAEQLLIWYWPNLSILLTGLLTFFMACLCGWLSWHLLEKPVMKRLRRQKPHPAQSESAC